MFFLKQSTTVTISAGPFLDATDGVTEEGALGVTAMDAELSKAGGAFANRNSTTTITADGTTGYYRIELNATDTNTVGSLRVKIHAAATHLPVWEDFQVLEEDIYEALFASGAAAFDSNDRVSVASFAASAITAASIATDAITAAKIAANAITSSEIADNAITAAKIATDAITSAKIAADAIGASEIAADAIGSSELATTAVNEIRDAILADSTAFNGADIATINTNTANVCRALATGTADSGTTTTLVDSALTQADTDYWKGAWLVMTSGNISGQARKISAFTPGTDTVTVERAFTQAVSTQTYEIWPADFPNNLSALSIDSSGRTDVSLIEGTDATNQIRDSILSDATTFQGADIAAILADTNSLDGTKIPDTISLANINSEVLDVVNTDTFSEESSGAPTATPTFKQMLMYLYMNWRNEVTQTATTLSVKNDAGTTICDATCSDDGTTATKGEMTAP